MGDFATIAAELVAGVLNTHPSTAGLVKAAMVRQLLNLQPEIAPFMERSGSFATVAGQAAYPSAVPGGLLRFERLWYDLGNYRRPIEVADMDTIRGLQEHPAAEYPFRAAWWEERLQFGPAPAGVYSVKWDIILDATKDTPTGTILTAASTTETNPWFLLPQVAAFKHLVWADYFMTSPDQRPEMAQSHQGLAQLAITRLREAGQKRQAMNSIAIVPNAYDRFAGGPGSPRDARVSSLFPGAPV
jgi:hypothetical protein